MRIVRIEPIAVRLPMAKPVRMAGEEVRAAENVLLRIESDDGTVGWGEAASAPTMTGETVASMLAALRYLAPVIEERLPEDIAGVARAMDRRLYGNRAAKAAVDIALHDLVGRVTNWPAHALLGQQRRDRAVTLCVIGSGDDDADLREAATRRAAGYIAYKIKVGVNPPDIDAARTASICDVLGSGLLVSADANQGWTTEDGVRYSRAVAHTALAFLEQPVAADDLDGMARVAAASPIPVAADEGIHSLDDIRRHHNRRAAAGVSLKAIKLGGMRRVLEAGALCAELGMAVNVSCKTGELSIGSAAALHIAAAMPSLAWGLTTTNQALAEDVTDHPLRVADGHLAVSARPGLGVEVDEARVRHFQIHE